MRIVCPVKRVPDTAAEKRVDPSDWTVDRDDSDPVLNANDEWALEEALRVREAGVDCELVVACMGPEAAQQTVRKALSYGLDRGVHVVDEAVAGSDALATARVLAAVIRRLEADMVLMGNQSSDARTMLVPAATAELLGWPALTFAKHLDVDVAAGRVAVQRETAGGHVAVSTALPAVVSVVEAINEPRYPSFKGVMAAKKKPLETWSLADGGVDPGLVGFAGSPTQVVKIESAPPRTKGETVTDDGTGTVGAKAIVDWLAAHKLG